MTTTNQHARRKPGARIIQDSIAHAQVRRVGSECPIVSIAIAPAWMQLLGRRAESQRRRRSATTTNHLTPQEEVSMTDSVPTWKFWHPVPFWQVVVMALVAQLVGTAFIVTLREGAGLPIPEWIAGGLGGLLMVIGVRLRAQRLLAKGQGGAENTSGT
jgi:hypothetical protein